jgi:pimeloyl-ACP methyl ester carboxylesterase
MVLADTGHEDLKFSRNFQALVDGELARRQNDRKWARPLHWFGVDRFLASENIDNPALSYDQQEWWYFLSQPGFIAAAASELENVDEGKAELRAAGTLGNKPLIVLIPEDLAKLHSSWDEFEMRLASLSSRGKWVMVPDSGHMIPFDRPEAIVSAAREICDDTRSQ